MKKILTVFMTLALLALICIPCFAQNDRLVVDEADILSDYEEQMLLEKLKEISDKINMDVVALTVYSLEGKNEMDYADDYFDYNGYGRGSDCDGVLLLIGMEDRVLWISTRGVAINAVTDYGIDVIKEEITSDFTNGDYYDGFVRYAELVRDFVNEYNENGQPYDTNNYYGDYDNSENVFSRIAISFIVAIVIAAIVTMMVKKSYKPVQFNRNASYYLDNGSLNITGSYEKFLYNHVTTVKIQSESSSSGGGSSTHVSSSGATHGGGGGHF